jgi:hypothetical protein
MSFKGVAHSKGLTIYSATPQSKLGFAPISIGVTIASLNAINGTSGGVFNPIRLIAPIVWGAKSDYFYIYLIGQFAGATAGALTRMFFVRFAKEEAKEIKGTQESYFEHMEKIHQKQQQGEGQGEGLLQGQRNGEEGEEEESKQQHQHQYPNNVKGSGTTVVTTVQ